jgi:hypothetical protein
LPAGTVNARKQRDRSQNKKAATTTTVCVANDFYVLARPSSRE